MEKLKSQLKKISNPIKAKFLQGYFKTGSGEYGEGDVFIGITVPDLREVAKEFEKIEFKELIYEFYLKHLQYVNNWDLVDEASRTILGSYLLDKDRAILYKLVKSKKLWERRNAIISTFVFLQNGESEDTIRISEILLADKEDLIHKATGWMLREMGKRVDVKLLEAFLDKHAKQMPRVMLRYAIEKLPEKTRKEYLK